MPTTIEMPCTKSVPSDPVTLASRPPAGPLAKPFCSSMKNGHSLPADMHGPVPANFPPRHVWRTVLGVLAALPLLTFIAGCPAPPAPTPTPTPTPTPAPPANTVTVQPIATGLTAPVALAQPDDASNRKFIVDQAGKVFILDANNNMLATPFLDVSGNMVTLTPEYDERGLLGLAFHPNYAANGRFFIKYNAPLGPADDPTFNSELRISEFKVSATDPNVADPNSERILLVVPKPQFNHNGGNILFGPDGFLYIAIGDGGAADDVEIGHNPTIGNAQDKSRLLGKMLRIDVDSGSPYGIPADNPFVNDNTSRPEIWAFGLRNPYAFSFDLGGTNQLFLGDVGQDLFEEVDIITKGGNYGWNIKEGFSCFNSTNPTSPLGSCPTVGPDGSTLIEPLFDYPHFDSQGNPFGIAVIGGFVYRGTAVPGFAGQYVFGDLSTSFLNPDASLFAATQQSDGTWTFRPLSVAGTSDNRLGRFLKGIGQDDQGELYLLDFTILGPTGTGGEVLKIVSGQ